MTILPLAATKNPSTQARADQAVLRAQVYLFLSAVFVYPRENWSEDFYLMRAIVAGLDFAPTWPALQPLPLAALQSCHRQAFGAAGSLCYETEYGLPHEYRQAQELADINGFYRAFGFSIGGTVRERPDHVAAELEFMHVLALKEAYALLNRAKDRVELCVDAQGKFLGDHLGTWIDLFAQSLALNLAPAQDDGHRAQALGAQALRPYLALARFAAAFVRADAGRLGVTLAVRSRHEVRHTPFDPDFSCAACPVVDLAR